MSITGGTNNQTKYFSSGAISFRALKDTFNSSAGNNNIKFSTYKRDTDKNETDPIVPDATENASISSSNSNLIASDFRNSIKQYIITQTSTDTEVDIDAQSWNSNLNKNVRKQFRVNGTIEADSPTDDAARFSAEAYNLTIRVGTSGRIYGEGGTGGTANGGDGGAGGDALFVNNTSNRSGASAKVTVQVLSSNNSNNVYGRIWAGGGGGGAGNKGTNGNNINCYFTANQTQNVYSGDSTNPQRACNRNCNNKGPNKNLPTGGSKQGNLYSNGNCYGTAGNRSRCRGSQERGGTCTNNYSRNCTYKYNYVLGKGNGGNGGNGGDGQGANRNAGNGNPGNSGNIVTCNANGNESAGNAGYGGAIGGGWGAAGGNTTNGGSGGAAGRALFRSNNTGNTFYVVGKSTKTIKGGISGNAS